VTCKFHALLLYDHYIDDKQIEVRSRCRFLLYRRMKTKKPFFCFEKTGIL